MRLFRLLAFTSLMLGSGTALLACSSAQPRLSPNEKLDRTAESRLERDVDGCSEQAAARLERLDENGTGQPSAPAILGALFGATLEAPIPRRSSLGHSAIRQGTLGDALASGDPQGPRTPEEKRRNLIEQCLEHKGYEVTGWS